MLLFKNHSRVKYSNFFSRMVPRISSISAYVLTLVRLLLNNSYYSLLFIVLLLFTPALKSRPSLFLETTVPRPASAGTSEANDYLDSAAWEVVFATPFAANSLSCSSVFLLCCTTSSHLYNVPSSSKLILTASGLRGFSWMYIYGAKLDAGSRCPSIIFAFRKSILALSALSVFCFLYVNTQSTILAYLLTHWVFLLRVTVPSIYNLLIAGVLSKEDLISLV